MPRQTLSEHRSKILVADALARPYRCWQLDSTQPLPPQLAAAHEGSDNLVVKVDEGVKGRGKKGLVRLDVLPNPTATVAAAKELVDQGYRWLLVEPMVAHEPSDERYLSLARDGGELVLTHTRHGGVDVESHQDTLEHTTIDATTDWPGLEAATCLQSSHLQRLVRLFHTQHLVFLEVNPYVAGDEPQFLDVATQVDDTGSYFVTGWSPADFRRPAARPPTPQEQAIQDLASKSPASFKLDVLNPDGSVFLLLSGGGASIVVADEVHNHGQGDKLANYGEYSGNPNTEETYLYTKAVLQLLLNSSADRKILFIGGAVANFTDIATTFDGIINALDEHATQLRAHRAKVFVRRGGPRQEVGLERMERALRDHDLLGAVHDPSTPLPEALTEALKGTL